MTTLRKRRFVLLLLLLTLAVFTLLNVLAYRHAHAMMHFSTGGERTKRPEQMTFLDKARLLVTGVNLPRPVTDLTPAALDPACREIRITPPGGPGLSTWYVDRGESSPLVLMFHGYGAEKTCMLHEARQFLAMGASVLLADFRGAGASEGNMTTIGALEALDVASVTEHARTGLRHRRVVLFGQSMGAAAILKAVRDHGVRPDAVILESVFDRMTRTVGNRFRTMGLPAFPSAHLLVFWAGRQCGFDGFAHNPEDYVAGLTCPVLFLHGRHDPRATVADARRVFAAAPEPKHFVEFPECAHGGFAAKDLPGWTAAVRPLVTRP